VTSIVAQPGWWLPGMDSNHDNPNWQRVCNLQDFQWPGMPNRTGKTSTRTQLVHGCCVTRWHSYSGTRLISGVRPNSGPSSSAMVRELRIAQHCIRSFPRCGTECWTLSAYSRRNPVTFRNRVFPAGGVSRRPEAPAITFPPLPPELQILRFARKPTRDSDAQDM
jgi:hypothetical protein